MFSILSPVLFVNTISPLASSPVPIKELVTAKG